jgi:hypothetical protein
MGWWTVKDNEGGSERGRSRVLERKEGSGERIAPKSRDFHINPDLLQKEESSGPAIDASMLWLERLDSSGASAVGNGTDNSRCRQQSGRTRIWRRTLIWRVNGGGMDAEGQAGVQHRQGQVKMYSA